MSKENKNKNQEIRVPIMWVVFILEELNVVLDKLDSNCSDSFVSVRRKRLTRINEFLESALLDYFDGSQ